MYFKNFIIRTTAIAALFISFASQASIIIPVYRVSETGKGQKIGTVTADDTVYGLLLQPNLTNLRPGVHGFHVHALPFCSNYGRGAGGHLDPVRTNQHDGPYDGSGHLGDLPVLIVDKRGRATLPILAPRLKLSKIQGKSLVIDSEGDNYADYPHCNGGGGERVACGVIGYF